MASNGDLVRGLGRSEPGGKDFSEPSVLRLSHPRNVPVGSDHNRLGRIHYPEDRKLPHPSVASVNKADSI